MRGSGLFLFWHRGECSMSNIEAMSRAKQETLLLEERIEKIRKRNEELKRRHLVSPFYPTN